MPDSHGVLTFEGDDVLVDHSYRPRDRAPCDPGRLPRRVSCAAPSLASGIDGRGFPFGTSAALALGILAVPGADPVVPLLPRLAFGLELDPALGAALAALSLLLLAFALLAGRFGRVGVLVTLVNAGTIALWLHSLHA